MSSSTSDYKEYFPNGNLKMLCTHNSCKKYRPDGTLRNEEVRLDTNYTRLQMFDPRGNMTLERHRDGDNKFHGSYKEWYGNGQHKSEATYEHGVLVGESKEWDANGELKSHCLWNKGECIQRLQA